jgi:hypothetical protein
MEVYMEALRPLDPPSLSAVPAEQIRNMLHTASIMDDLDRSEGWRQLVGQVRAARNALVEDLALGKFRPARKPPLTTEEVQAMVFALDTVIGIPATARAAYEQWRQSQQAQHAATEKLDARAENMPYSSGTP